MCCLRGFPCECGFHFDYPPRERFKTFGFKEGFQEIKAPTYMNSDPLKFQFSDSKYIDKRKLADILRFFWT